MSRPRRVLLVVAGVLVRDGRILLARRPPGVAFAGLWELAGGKVEPGETPSEALVREWEEELGVRVAGSRPLGFVEHAEPGLHLTLLAFAVTALLGEPAEVTVAGLRWATPDEARLVAVPPSDRVLIDRILALGGGRFEDTEGPDAPGLVRRAQEEEPYLHGSESLAPGVPLFFVKRGLLGRERLRGFVVATPLGVRAFVDACPHAVQSLDRDGGPALTTGGTHLVCPVHGSEISVDTGLCGPGPCEGLALTPLPLVPRGAGWALAGRPRQRAMKTPVSRT